MDTERRGCFAKGKSYSKKREKSSSDASAVFGSNGTEEDDENGPAEEGG